MQAMPQLIEMGDFEKTIYSESEQKQLGSENKNPPGLMMEVNFALGAVHKPRGQNFGQF